MHMTIGELDALLQIPVEDEHVEFKAAVKQFDKKHLAQYCAAFANEGGGQVVLGVTDSRPRRVVGTVAFGDLSELKRFLRQVLGHLVEVQELQHPDGRVLICHVSGRRRGHIEQVNGTAWKRVGESLVTMTWAEMKQIAAEGTPDYSAEFCVGADLQSLDSDAIADLRTIWTEKSGNQRLASLGPDQLLADAGLLVEGRVTNAAVLLLGTEETLNRLIPQAEVVFEYRHQEDAIPSQQRLEYRAGFLLYEDLLWEAINSHNEAHRFQQGFFVREVLPFNERVVREAILNAVCHRDYYSQRSVFVRQTPIQMEVVSPGGFPPGVTQDNILRSQCPRNRLLAEVLAKCGLVERSGQGVDLMFHTCLKEGKPRPDFTGTDDYEVRLTLRGRVQDVSFLRFLELVAKERQRELVLEDLLVLDLIHRDQKVPPDLKERLPALREAGVIEHKGGTRHILSQRYYQFVGKEALYTRKLGLERDENKALLLKHIQRKGTEGAPARELRQVLPSVASAVVRDLLQQMRKEGLIHPRGKTSGARWYLGPALDEPPLSVSTDDNN